MPKGAAPWNQAAHDWLADHGPQPLRGVRDFIAARVPPGMAYRRGARERIRRNQPVGRNPDEVIISGGRAIGHQTISAWLRGGTWVRLPDNRIGVAPKSEGPTTEVVGPEGCPR